MKKFGFICTLACFILINETFGYAIDRHVDKNNSRSLSSNTKIEREKINDANNSAVLLDENAKIDGINEGDSKSIIHLEHKVKRCESMTSLRKPRFTSPRKIVNNEKIEVKSKNLLNDNDVTVSSSKLNNNSMELSEPETTMENENISTKFFSQPIIKSLQQIDERPEISIEQNDAPKGKDEVALFNDKVKRHDDQRKKYICYCVEDGCTKNHARPHQKSYRNQLSSHQNVPMFEDSQENSEEDDAESLRSALEGGKKRPGNKRPKNKKCMPIIIPCSFDDSPTKLEIPVEPKPTQPSAINPYHAEPNSYQSYQTVPDASNYYGSPYIMYHPVHAVNNFPSQQRFMEEDRLGSVHGSYDVPYATDEGRSFNPLESLSESHFNGYPNSYHSHNPSYVEDYGDYHENQEIIDSNEKFMVPNNYHATNVDDDYQVESDRDENQRLPSHYETIEDDFEGPTHRPGNAMASGATEADDMIDNYDDDENFEPLNTPMYPSRQDETGIDEFPHSNDYSNEFEDDFDTQVETEQKGPGHPSRVEHMTEDEVDIFAPFEGPTHLPKQDEPTNNYDDFDTNRFDESDDDTLNYGTSTESDEFQQLRNPTNSNEHEPVIPPSFHHTSNVPSRIPQSGDWSTSIPDLFQDQLQPSDRTEDYNEDQDTINKAINKSSPIGEEDSDLNVSSNYEDYDENSSEEPSPAPAPEVYEPNNNEHSYRTHDSTTESATMEPSRGHQPDAIRINTAPPDYTASTENIDDYDNEYESGPHDETIEQPTQEYESIPENPQEARQPDQTDEYSPVSEITVEPQTSTEARSSELVCPELGTESPSAEQHLEDLQALTGLSIEDSKLLRGTIYKALTQVITRGDERSRITSPCDVIGASEPSEIKRMKGLPFLKNVLDDPDVRASILNIVKTLIPQVTSVSRRSSLGKLTDNVIEHAVDIVRGDDGPRDSEEPELGIVNENVPLLDRITKIIESIINRPGIGLYGAKFPEVQNIIVRTVENIVNKAKNVVDNSVIWEALNDVLNRSRRPGTDSVIPRPPVHKHEPLPRPSIHGTKPLLNFPVIEHNIKDGEWREEPATIGYNNDYPRAQIPNLSASRDNYDPVDEPEETVDEESVIDPPIHHHSPENLQVKYLKDHSVEQSNPASYYLGSNEESATPAYSNENDNNLEAIRIPPLAYSHEVTTEYPTKSSTKIRKYQSKKNRIAQQFSESDGKALEAARVFPGSEETPDNTTPSTFLGRITSDSDLSSISNVEDLVGANLYYIGDGAKLPLTVTRMADGSFALSISNKVCEHFVKENCPCCAAKLENVRISSNAQNEGVRTRKTKRRGNSRQIRATTANENEAISTVEDIPTITEMPADKFTRKYNLTLKFDDKNEIKSFNAKKGSSKKFDNPSANDLIPSRSVDDSEGVKVVLELSDEPEIMNDMEKNRYIQDLLKIHDVPEENRAELVINALDGLLNSSENEKIHDNESIKNKIKGFEYQIDNPIMERIKYIKEKEMKREKYKYQQNFDEAAKERMETAKSILNWLKELIVKSKDNNIS